MAVVSDAKMSSDARLMAPATARNREAITKVLSRAAICPLERFVLEVASGTGEHITHFASALSPRTSVFQPTDADGSARASIDAWVASTDVRNVLPAIALDASADAWPIQRADAVTGFIGTGITPNSGETWQTQRERPGLSQGCNGRNASGPPGWVRAVDKRRAAWKLSVMHLDAAKDTVLGASSMMVAASASERPLARHAARALRRTSSGAAADAR